MRVFKHRRRKVSGGWEDNDGLEGKHQMGMNACWDAVQKSHIRD